MNRILEQRLINGERQIKSIKQRQEASDFVVARYQERDSQTGLRKLELADGGELEAVSISNSKPKSYPPAVAIAQGGRAGFMDQKPV